MIDISLSGCMVESSHLPRRMERQSVWVRPLGVAPSDWAEGIIVSVRKPLFGKSQVRVAFLAPFPYESFKGLVYGPENRRELADSASPEHEQDHFWK